MKTRLSAKTFWGVRSQPACVMADPSASCPPPLLPCPLCLSIGTDVLRQAAAALAVGTATPALASFIEQAFGITDIDYEEYARIFVMISCRICIVRVTLVPSRL